MVEHFQIGEDAGRVGVAPEVRFKVNGRYAPPGQRQVHSSEHVLSGRA